jgi:FkbM family methyltransferase
MLRRLFGRTPDPALSSLESEVRQLRQRLEEAIAYFAQRSNPHYHAPTTPLGGHVVLGMLEGRLPMYLDSRGSDVAPHIMTFGMWEPNYAAVFKRLVRPGDTVFDIGAHLGVYTLLAGAATGPTGQVHAFEPNQRFATLLARSIAVNGLTGFTQVHNLAVGAEEGTTSLRFSWEYAGGGHLAIGLGERPAELSAQKCRVAPLDALFPDAAFTLDVVKMDVEGTETFALRGMSKLLGRSPRVRIMFEFAPAMLASHGSSAAELIGLFAELGFHFWDIEADASLTPQTAGALSARDRGVANILASRGDPVTG